MKTVTIQNQEFQITKKFIREILELEKSVYYYTRYNNNELASVISFGSVHFAFNETPITENIDSIYNNIDEIISSYEWYQKELKAQSEY